MAGTAASFRLIGHGFRVLPAGIDLQPTASGTWTDTGLEVVLPAAGTYHLDAVVRGNLHCDTPVNAWIGARLFDVTAGAVIPASELLVYQISLQVSPATSNVAEAGNQSGTISIPYTVPGPRTVRLQVVRVNSVGSAAIARVLSDVNGRTTLRYERVA
ncbi:hypothetical protein [Streptomyces sp. NPDC006355]|uniref:hypothetical protein n=1 Tax=Streptomyces sp. NPDC006355 TaxID=3156758 RepID=UPI0033BB46E5